MDIVEIVRLLRAGESDRTITQVVRCNRRTVAKYRAWAGAHDLLTGAMPTSAALHRLLAQTLPGAAPPQQVSTVAPYAEEIAAYRAQGLELAAIRARLEETHGHPVSYHALWRLVRHLEPRRVEAVVRVEVKPGSEAQVDFGAAGLLLDPRSGAPRKAWVFVLVLSWSRHMYAELVFDQRVETWLRCHQHAFESWGGVPARIVPDNLKAAVVRASFTEPLAQRAYRECAEHYDFLIDPNPPRSPHLKGKVEQGGVHYVKRNFLAGRTPQPLDRMNAALWRWLEQAAGRRVHGTTKQVPLERFAAVERAALRPLPATPYDPAAWKQVRVYRDCHLTFEGAYYSVPYRLVGAEVWVRGGTRTVEVYTADHHLVATHDRATEAGQRQTILAHLPPQKIPNLVLTRELCLRQAQAIGPATTRVVQALLDHRPEDRLRSAGRLVRLAQQTSPERLERACQRAQACDAGDYATIKRIVQGHLETTPLALPAPLPPPRSYTFVRHASEFVASLFGGQR
jgi:transposase